MKKLVLVSVAVLLVLNLMAKIILPGYEWFNFGLSSLVLCNNALLLYALSYDKIADAFKVAMIFIYPFIGFIVFVLSQFSIPSFKNNVILLLIIMASGFEWLGLVLLRVISKVNTFDVRRHKAV